jgi:hypothetical protein
LEDIGPDSGLVRRIYAYFGHAIYAAQVLERGIVNLAVWTGVRDGSIRAAEDTDAEGACRHRKGPADRGAISPQLRWPAG